MSDSDFPDSMRRSKKNNSRKRPRFYKRKGFWLFMATCAVLGLIALAVADRMLEEYREQAMVYDLTKIDDVEVPSRIFDRNGREIGSIFVQNRRLVSREEIPEAMINALVAGEDKRFFRHSGVDYIGIGRAFFLNWKAGRQTQGASTITQQLARNAFPIKEDAEELSQAGYERKLTEVFVARRIEAKFTKDEIVTMYLNRIAFGSGFYGIRAASMGYFGVEPIMLTVPQCATLVGCIKNPNTFSPLNSKEASKRSRDNVLRRMAEEEFLTFDEAERYKRQPIELDPQPFERNTSHLYARVVAEARELVGEKELTGRGYRIFTTIDADLQELAVEQLEEQMQVIESDPMYRNPTFAGFEKRKKTEPDYLQAAMMTMNHRTGEVLAYVGGRDFSRSQYDIVQSGRRPLGTGIFPFVYAAAFSRGESPVTQLLDEPIDQRAVMVGGTEGILAEWGFESENPVHEGTITARRGLAASKIAATVRLGTDVGLGDVMQTGRDFGLRLPEGDVFTRELLGFTPVSIPEVMTAYGTLANGGRRPAEPRLLVRIEDSAGNVLRNAVPSSLGERVIDEVAAYQVHSALQTGGKDGSSRGISEMMETANFAGAVKTGTTYDFSDNWVAGYEGDLTCAIWLGFINGTKEGIARPAFARDTILPVWAEVMRVAENDGRGVAMARPDELEAVTVCRQSGRQVTRFCYAEEIDERTGNTQFVSTGYTEYLRRGGEGLSYCEVHGEEGGGLADLLEEFSPDAAPPEEKQLLAIPIRPQGSALVGSDPYGARMPSLAVVEPYDPRRAPTTDLSDFRMPGREAAELTLPPPSRLEIVVD